MIPWEDVNKVSLGGAVTLSGVVLVFLALIILIAVVTLMGKILGTKPKPKNQSAEMAPAQVATQIEEPPVLQQQGSIDDMAVAAISAAVACAEDDVEEDVVAAITAAVACVMQEIAPGTAYTVTNIQRRTGARPVWGFAGMQQNTRPF